MSQPKGHHAAPAFLDQFKKEITCPITKHYFLQPVLLVVKGLDAGITIEEEMAVQYAKTKKGFPSEENIIISYHPNDLIKSLVGAYLTAHPEEKKQQYQSTVDAKGTDINMPNIVAIMMIDKSENRDINYRRVLIIADVDDEQREFVAAAANEAVSSHFFSNQSDIKFIKTENYKYGVYSGTEKNQFKGLAVDYVHDSHFAIMFAGSDNSWDVLSNLKEQLQDLRLYKISYNSKSNTASLEELDKSSIREIKHRKAPVKINSKKIHEMMMRFLPEINRVHYEGLEKIKAEKRAAIPKRKKGWFAPKKS